MGLWVRKLGLSAAVAAVIAPGDANAGRAASTAGVDLVPHRAIYSLSMGRTNSSGQFVNVGGAVRAVLEKTCDAWISAEQVRMQVTTQSGGQLRQDLSYTGWESLDGRKYRFAARSSTNGEITKYRGIAHSDPDTAGEAVYSEPKKNTMSLPSGTQFYFGLTSWLIEKARSGARRVETTVFDGTDEEGPQKAIAFIIPLKSMENRPKAKANKNLGPLVDRPGWKMHMAFYPLGGQAAEPDYEVRAVVLDNGITPKLELVFTSFTAIQTLEKIEALDEPEC